jgi:hypothetical protein
LSPGRSPMSMMAADGLPLSITILLRLAASGQRRQS